MGRANPASKAREIRRRISIAERARKKYERSFHDFYNQYVKGDISHEKYHGLISRKKEGKDIQEWIDYLDSYIGDLKRRLRKEKGKSARKSFMLAFFSLFFIFVFLAIISFSPDFTGSFVQEDLSGSIRGDGFSIDTFQFQATLGEPVVWKKDVSLDSPENINVLLPVSSENIIVQRIDYSYSKKEEALENGTSPSQQGSLLNGNKIEIVERSPSGFFGRVASLTGSVVNPDGQRKAKEVFIKDNGTRYEITYETPAPYAIEEEKENGKIVTIVGPENIHYKRILAHSDVEEVRREAITLYWLNDGKKELVENVTYIDSNQNNLIDRVEWIVPYLSSQTYEIEIKVLNPYTYVRDGETWIVALNTTGVGDLKISSPNAGWEEVIADDPNIFDEMRFLDLTCGEDSVKNELLLIDHQGVEYNYSSLNDLDVVDVKYIVSPGYTCDTTSFFSNYMNKAGYATLFFEFSNENATVNDFAYGAITFSRVQNATGAIGDPTTASFDATPTAGNLLLATASERAGGNAASYTIT